MAFAKPSTLELSISNQVSQDDNSIARHVEDRAAIQWKAPPLGVVKINMDAAYESEENVAGFAAVMRNSSGEIMSCKTVLLMLRSWQ
ncbi:putative nucleic acid binding protein [Corchorus olitorius]|uniref:Nucleic acid binding protein n=1 Tax=Corchorus olitorius TaxID=93759 RepID=A0A1R3IE87_9ROSI|nr:putative nucleic acid binding protein [Corchorus olitorius]